MPVQKINKASRDDALSNAIRVTERADNLKGLVRTGLEEKAKWWGGNEIFIGLVMKQPSIAGYSAKEDGGLEEKAKWWGGKEVFIGLVMNHQSIASYSPKEDGSLAQKARWWGGKEAFLELAMRNPGIAKFGLDNLEDKMRLFGLDKEKFVAIAKTFPHIVNYSVETYIVPRLEYAKSLGMAITPESYKVLLSGNDGAFIKKLNKLGFDADHMNYMEFSSGIISRFEEIKREYIKLVGGDMWSDESKRTIGLNAPRFIDRLRKIMPQANLEAFLDFREARLAA